MITPLQHEAFRIDGAVLLKGVFSNWLDVLAAGAVQNRTTPGPDWRESPADEQNAKSAGAVFESHNSWSFVPQYQRFLFESDAAEMAATLMQSPVAQLFGDHFMMRDCGPPEKQSWKRGAAHFQMRARQSLCMFCPLDPMPQGTLRLLAGSQDWNVGIAEPERSKRFSKLDPNFDPYEFNVCDWALEPGDAVLYHLDCLQSAHANPDGLGHRLLSFYWVGQDARYARPNMPVLNPKQSLDLESGATLPVDVFPILWPRA